MIMTLVTCRAGICQNALPVATPYKKDPGPHAVEVQQYTWTDPARNRDVPVKIYYPKAGTDRLPIIIFSHGLGGSREGYEYLGRHWASYGYVSVHVQHLGSDTAVWQNAGQPMKAMTTAASDWRNAVNRPRDISFAIDEMERMNLEDTPLKNRLDMNHVGVAGHSFGAHTTLGVAGQVFIGPRGGQFSMGDGRVKAALPMSAPVTKGQADLDRSYGAITIPCLHMTGTLDDSPIGDTRAGERRMPFDHMKNSDQYLVIFNGGDHMIFSGRGQGRLGAGGEKDPLFQQLILMSSTAFWDAYLKGDANARTWLAGGAFAAVLGHDGTLEVKLK